MPSFDIVSEFDLQEVRNAVDQTAREAATRYDFKGTGTTVEMTRATATIGEVRRTVIDTPGINSLLPQSQDEIVARDLLLRERDIDVVQVGDIANLIVRGGPQFNAGGLLRWYLAHVLLLPVVGIIFLGVHYYKVVIHGHSLPPEAEAVGEDTAQRVPVDQRTYFMPVVPGHPLVRRDVFARPGGGGRALAADPPWPAARSRLDPTARRHLRGLRVGDRADAYPEASAG